MLVSLVRSFLRNAISEGVVCINQGWVTSKIKPAAPGSCFLYLWLLRQLTLVSWGCPVHSLTSKLNFTQVSKITVFWQLLTLKSQLQAGFFDT